MRMSRYLCPLLLAAASLARPALAADCGSLKGVPEKLACLDAAVTAVETENATLANQLATATLDLSAAQEAIAALQEENEAQEAMLEALEAENLAIGESCVDFAGESPEEGGGAEYETPEIDSLALCMDTIG